MTTIKKSDLQFRAYAFIKTLCLLSSIFMLILNEFVYAQYPGWNQYTSGKSIQAIVGDGDYIWVGTSGGVVLINKVNEEVKFITNANSSLPYNDVSDIAIDKNGNKWFATFGGGIAMLKGMDYWNPNNWKIYNTSNSQLLENTLHFIAVDKDNFIWAGGKRGLVRISAASIVSFTTSNSQLPNNDVRSIAFDKNGEAWIGTYGGGLARFDYLGRKWTVYNITNSGLKSNDITKVAYEDKFLWIGTDGYGLIKLNLQSPEQPASWKVFDEKSGIGDRIITAIFIDHKNNKYVGTLQAGAFRLEKSAFGDETNVIQYNDKTALLPGLYVKALYADRTDKIWIGTTQGLAYNNGKNWSVIETSNSGLSTNIINSLAFDKSNNIWIATNEGISVLSGKSWTVYNSTNSEIKDNRILSIAIDARNNKWFGTNTLGIYRLAGKNEWANYRKENSGLPFNRINVIKSDNKNTLWIGFNTGAVAKMEGERFTVFSQSNSKVPNSPITDIEIDKNDNVWIGTDGLGLVLHKPNSQNPNESWQIFNSSNSSLSNGTITSIKSDNDGNVWIGTKGGLFVYIGGNFNSYNTSNSDLPENDITSVAVDKTGNVYIGTARSGVVAYMRDIILDGKAWINYTFSNSGLPDNEITSIIVDGNNTKWIATKKGLASFSQKVELSEAIPPKYPPLLSVSLELYEQSGNRMLDPFEKASFRFYIQNNGKDAAQGFTIKIEPITTFTSVKYAREVNLGTIRAGQKLQIDVPIQANEKVDFENLQFNVKFDEAFGFEPEPIKFTIPTKENNPPNLMIADVAFEDNNRNGKIEPGELVKITVMIKNEGNGDARDVVFRIKLGEDVFIAGDSQTEFMVGNLTSKEFRNIKFSVFTSARAVDIPIFVDILEASKKYDKKDLRLPLKLNR